MKTTCINDWKLRAKRHLPPDVYDFIAGGAGHESGVLENTNALERVKLVSRVLRGVECVNTDVPSLALLCSGHAPKTPFFIAPTAHHQLAHPAGEMATLAAANQCNTPFILSMMSDTQLENVCEQSQIPILFQLYLYKDRQVTKDIIQRAQEAGCTALVLTVDVPRMGARLRDRRNEFDINRYAISTNKLSNCDLSGSAVGDASVAAFVERKLEPALSWADVEWVKLHTRLPLILKGVLHPRDAEIAVEHGVDALYLSNHGGRQLDHHVSAVTVLPHIRRRLGEAVPIIVDGGIRSGTDALKALALGADAVGVGRPILWGLAGAGANGVTTVLQQLIDDLVLGMHICGCSSLSDVNEEIIWTE